MLGTQGRDPWGAPYTFGVSQKVFPVQHLLPVMEFRYQWMVLNIPILWDTRWGQGAGEGLGGTVALSQLGHTVALSPLTLHGR